MDLRVYRSGRRGFVDEDGDRFPPWIFTLAFLMLFSATLAVCTIETENPVRSDESVEAPATLLLPIGDVPEFALEETLEPVSTEMSLLIRHAVADLALRLQVTEEAIEVVGVETVECPNTGLGCPQPGMMSAKVVTPGYKISLEALRETYLYHTDTRENILLCDEGSAFLFPTFPPPKNADDRSPWKPVDANPTVVIPD